MPRYTRRILLFFSDTHGGQSIGLLNPETIVTEFEPDGEGGTIEYESPVYLTNTQKVLWNIYEWCIEEVLKLAGRDEIIPIHVGDTTQGKKYWHNSHYASFANQITIAVSNMQPWMKAKNVKKMRLIWGTASHEFEDGSAPKRITRELSLQYPKKSVRCSPHSLFMINGEGIDCAHHGPAGGTRSWLRGNQFRYYIKSLMDDEVKGGRQPPLLVVRGHYHDMIEERVSAFYNGTRHHTTGILCPSFTFISDYARQKTRSVNRATNGLCAVEMINNKIIDLHWFWKTHDLRIKEDLS